MGLSWDCHGIVREMSGVCQGTVMGLSWDCHGIVRGLSGDCHQGDVRRYHPGDCRGIFRGPSGDFQTNKTRFHGHGTDFVLVEIKVSQIQSFGTKKSILE